jgi:tetratricopeptide (TPR) repeat protein
MNKGVDLQVSGQYKKAIEYYDKVLAIDPNHVGALNNKGSSWRFRTL